MQFFTIISFLAKLPGLIEALFSFYKKIRVAVEKKQNTQANKEADEKHSQIGLEDQLNSPKAGQPSNLPDVELRDSLPDVLPGTGRD